MSDKKIVTESGVELDYGEMASGKDGEQIRHDMIIRDVVARYPETMEVMFEYGVHCVGCGYASFETMEQGAALHRIDLQEYLEDLNDEVFG